MPRFGNRSESLSSDHALAELDLPLDCCQSVRVIWLPHGIQMDRGLSPKTFHRTWRSRPHGVIAGATRPETNHATGGWLFPDRMEIRAHDLTPGPSIEWRTAMEEYIGLDVSMKETAVSIRREGERIWRGKCASDPKIIAELIRKRAPP